MRPHFRLGAVLILAIAVVVGAAVFGFFGVAFYPMPGAQMISLLARGFAVVLAAAANVVVLGGCTGAVVWMVMFLLRRDGFHRLEWIALQQRNYGGKSPFALD